jgi:Kdo2-lipid IVA lauroyltransferase/acyltransferase
MPQKGAMLRTIRHLKDGGKMGMLIDLNLKPSEAPVVVRQFRHFLVPVTRLPAELALRTGAALVPVVCLPRPDRGYIVRYLPELPVIPEDSIEQIAQKCWDVLELHLHDHPELWLWSYKHWRYRPRGEEGEAYPFYANHDPAFDRLMEESQKKDDSRLGTP